MQYHRSTGSIGATAGNRDPDLGEKICTRDELCLRPHACRTDIKDSFVPPQHHGLPSPPIFQGWSAVSSTRCSSAFRSSHCTRNAHFSLHLLHLPFSLIGLTRSRDCPFKSSLMLTVTQKCQLICSIDGDLPLLKETRLNHGRPS